MRNSGKDRGQNSHALRRKEFFVTTADGLHQASFRCELLVDTAVLATGQISIVHLSDGKSLSCYITSNLLKTQILDPNPAAESVRTGRHASPVAHAGDLRQPDHTVSRHRETSHHVKCRDAAGRKAALTDGEAVSGDVLTVSANKLSSEAFGLPTYPCYATYVDLETGAWINVVVDISFSQNKTDMNAENACIFAGSSSSTQRTDR